MRDKYRSAVYVTGKAQRAAVQSSFDKLQQGFETLRITQILDWVDFKPSDSQFQNYYKTDPARPFCQTYIDPKLDMLRTKYTRFIVSA